jgi:hypothetical protein
MKRAHLYLTDRPLGPYTAVLQVTTFEGGESKQIAEVDLDLKQLLVHRQHLDNAIDAIRDRQFSDAVCGHCEVCSDTRMATEERHGGPWSIHCPVCHPKLEAARAVLSTGLEATS